LIDQLVAALPQIFRNGSIVRDRPEEIAGLALGLNVGMVLGELLVGGGGMIRRD
jgi:hypothetical protein